MPKKDAIKPTGQRRQPVQRVVDLARATNLALAGATYRQIATDLEVDEETVRYHLTSPEGQRALRYAVNELQERTDRFLASAHLQAIRRLVREMEEADKPGDRIRAAQAITMLAAKRIEVSGPNGSPIQVDTSTVTMLDERIARMRERSRTVIDTTSHTVTEEPLLEMEDTSEPETLDVAAPQVVAPELVTPTAPTRPSPHRAPADFSPGHGLRIAR
jgi:hypothetical protein